MQENWKFGYKSFTQSLVDSRYRRAMNPAMDSVLARREHSHDEFEKTPAPSDDAHTVSVGGFGPSTGVASDMAYGAVSPAEQALQIAARRTWAMPMFGPM